MRVIKPRKSQEGYMGSKTMLTIRTVTVVLAIATAMIVSGASALTASQRIQHINQVVAAIMLSHLALRLGYSIWIQTS